MRHIIVTVLLLAAVIATPAVAVAGGDEPTSTGAGDPSSYSAGGADRELTGREFVRQNRLVEQAMNRAALACMHRSGALLGLRSPAKAFGGYAVDGRRVAARASVDVSARCAREATVAALSATGPRIGTSSGTTTTTMTTSTTGGSDPAGDGTVGAAGGGCPNPSIARQWIYGQTEPRWVGMNELVFLGLNNFLNNWRALKQPCYHNWVTDGCSVPVGAVDEPAFRGSCYRHDWGYRNVQKGHELYAARLWIAINKAAADTRFLYDMRNKCASMNLSDFERDRCRDKAGVYYTAVAKFYSSPHYESYDTYGIFQEGFVLP